MSISENNDIATCIGCGCDDNHACWSDATDNPCHWVRLDREAGLGVCSACPDDVKRWDAGDRSVSVSAEPAGLSIWTIYDSPSDMPGKFVARKWINNQPTNECHKADTLKGIRQCLPPGLTQMPAQRGDDPVIVETWF